MGVSEGEIIWLEDAASQEIERLEAFEETYRDSVAAFVERNFPEGSEGVYDELPDRATSIPRYLDPPYISESSVIDVSNQAIYADSFATLRVNNLQYALTELDENFRVLRTSSDDLRGTDLFSRIKKLIGSFEEVSQELEGVAMFLDGAEDLPGEPFNRMNEVYHQGLDGKTPVKKVDSDDFNYALENYWLFSNTDSYKLSLN